MSPPQRAGKTAPRLLQDIALYDPDHPAISGLNLLSGTPPVFPESYHGPPELVPSASCRHSYVTKSNQTLLSPGTMSKVSAICFKCRYHLQVVANHTRVIITRSQSSQQDHLHHLVYKLQRGGAARKEITTKGQRAETFNYDCSYPKCSVAVSVRLASPLLSPEWVDLLTDPELLQKRAQEAVSTYPDRLEGVGPPLPINVLDNLRAYVSNALHDRHRGKSISPINKRFMICFGVEGKPCKELLEFLEFRSKNDGFWEPPQPDPSAVPPYQDEFSSFLDDVILELSALIDQRPAAEKKTHNLTLVPTSADGELSAALGASNYSKAPRTSEFELPSAPYYEDLGAVEDMSSSLIIEAYNRQVSVDHTRAPHYLRCLKMIGHLRGGSDREAIEQAVMVAYSEGKYTDEDVAQGFKYFGLDPGNPNITEETIIGKFYAFLRDTTQEKETETRRHLWRIGVSRGSERIKFAAEERVTTPAQALVFLSVHEDTSDDFIITMYTTKIDDSPASKELARHAVSLIAESRNSDTLRHFLKTGEAGVTEMDVGDAYLLLQIPDRTVDDTAILAAYTICVNEAPAQVETYTRALGIIAQEKNSSMLSSHVLGSTTNSNRNQSEWPVGLQNIGNTCYLNSLLQFYFTVRPYREMVLNFEDFKTDLEDETLQLKKVGSRMVSRQEVERSQKFLRELRGLFHNMITSPYSSVTPEQELARLTLISSSNEAAIRRRSTISGNKPWGLDDINGMPVVGPLGPPQSFNIDRESTEKGQTVPSTPDGQQAVKESGTSDIDSEATLVAESAKDELGGSRIDNNKENQPPSERAVDESTDTTIIDTDNPLYVNSAPFIGPLGPPNHPPPVPPRPSQVDRQRQLIEEVEIGAQQDVTEVINNVLFQSECAIKPIGTDADGEQLDQIKDLFYGRTTSYITAERGVRSKEELWSDIKVDVATGPRDIYAAIDGAFDMQKVLVDGELVEQFGSISKLPPILQIQVQRAQFDPIKKTSFKSTHHLELKDTIYLDRYMDTPNPELLNRRRECWKWKDNLRMMEARRVELQRQNEKDGQDMASLFNNTKCVLEELVAIKEDSEISEEAVDIDPQIVIELDRLSQIKKTEIAFVDQEMKNMQTMIASQFVDSWHLAYRLYAVFMHQGSVEFGHYYIYIYDFSRDVWRHYNDAQVTEVQDPTEIFDNEHRVNPPTPYFLIYVNDAMKDRLVDPIRREILDIPPGPVPYGPQLMTEVDPSSTIDGVPAMSMAEDVDMDPPPYEERANSGPAGMSADPNQENPGAGIDSNVDIAQGGRRRDYIADKDNVRW